MDPTAFNFRTIATMGEGIYKEKGSRFLGFAFPVSTEGHVRSKLEELRRVYHDARHHCYAYRLGYEKKVFRTNDAGEPSGTAGRPILGQIESHDLTNILIVVIRYFGGIKLGTGGLAIAYRTAAREAIHATEIIERQVTDFFEITFEYGAMPEVMKIIKEEKLETSEKSFTDVCKILLLVPREKSDALKHRIDKVSGTSVNITEII
ncbi:MAG: YigZ family protein [Bacteroidetes bacterium]|nr:YigZ family protein [Bacteroidota bacterium]